MINKVEWWEKAKEASKQTGWLPTVILAQWQHETGNFASANLMNNNNIAGQTWQPYMSEALRGSARPKVEGGYYIKYADPVIGYVDFIQTNGRYKDVKLQTTEAGQIGAIAAAGWAADKRYAELLMNCLAGNRNQGFTLERWEDETLKLDENVVHTIINTWIKPAWGQANESNDTKEMDYMNWLANQLRQAAGLPLE
ncbi:hypothetical protein GQF01_13220 [Paenibacillus sp. 5J-6]|uniref:Mannosyl-glycoprotein endo-beta-N-acetylglucosamidase-like domain-containing protein n=1 Tax=Paenibacillus silvestris TaxID=2606219 RepID=A0A6L8UXX0_9BACL|nr:glucosaminidase domain-containing protein [Paenibacillus silvestris]MZQ83068.1 hypothetical protein [Paenibacillus silvestris]